MKDYGKILQNERKARNYTQEQVAQKIGVSQAQISYYEKNINLPSIDIIEALADFYGISIDELVDHEVKKNW